ncbi:MAG: hypothetical protein NZ895_06880 [Archaeoglobaceae archaeon]|nr:hypothetical protein [Archaeoglobaceae archaeon]MCX8152064.1 hypothetical protein [Archaeoglobaceae archaeon]MDW8013829.1 hypothetical protein [Archaeoglobaceae archaeon]
MITIVGSRLLMNIISRVGIKVKYLSDFVTPNDVMIDCSIDPLEANCYDVVEPFKNVESYLFFGDDDELFKIAEGSDIIVAHKYLDVAARVAEKMEIPFMPNIVTTFIPGKIKFEEVEIPKVEYDSISYALLCSLQASEIIKFYNKKDLIVAPEAVIVESYYYLKTTLRMR